MHLGEHRGDGDTSTSPVTTPTPPGRRGRRGDGYVYQRPGTAVWWIRFYCAGRDHRESSGCTDRRGAEKRLRQRLDDVGADRVGARKFVSATAQRVRVADLLDALVADYGLRGGRAPAQFLAHLKPIRAAFGHRRAVDVKAAMIDRYVTDRLTTHKAATVNRETQILGQAFRLAVAREQITAAPAIRRLAERNTRTGFFERADFEAVAAHLPADVRDAVTFGYYSGWRKGEVAALAWGDVDLSGRVIRLRGEDAKNGRGRTLALEGALADVVARRQAARTIAQADGSVRLAELVFHRDGRPVGDFRKVWASACRKAGVAGRLVHDLRRSAVRNLVRAGVSEHVAMSITGHRTRSVFDRYDICDERDLRDAALKVQAFTDAQTTTRNVVALPVRAGAVSG